MRQIAYLIAMFMIILFTSPATADETYQGPQASLPGVSVVIGKIPSGVKLDEFGCAQLTPALYKCYAGMLAGQQFTTRQEALMTFRMVMNPTSFLSKNAPEFANGGANGSRGFEYVPR